MSKRRDLTAHQKGIVRRYYDNKEAIMHQKVAEIVSDLCVCEDAQKAAQLWRSAQTALLNLGAPEARLKRLVADRDIEDLAKLAGELF